MSLQGSSCTDHPDDPQFSEFLSLPDDALLAVLAYLPLRELFSCRVVCRRLRDLCLHPHLWRNAEVGGQDGLAVACFALAPCLRHLGSSRAPVRAVQTFLYGEHCLHAVSTCIVTHLWLRVDSPADAPEATAFIEKLSSLGGLRSLTLMLWCSWCSHDETSAFSLLKAVCDIDHIQELHVMNYSSVVLPGLGCPVKASLRRLEYESLTQQPFLQYLLKSHAATLEEVRLCIDNQDVPVTLLAKISGLHALSCSPHKDMCELLVLPQLDTITFSRYNDFPDGALEFLRRARHLQHVSTYSHCVLAGQQSAVQFSALSALAESWSARAVESLTFQCQPPREVLVAILPRLPSLKELTITHYISDEFALAISPTSAPSLAKVSLATSTPTPYCWHRWLHGGAFPGLLLRNPRLHLQLKWRQPIVELTRGSRPRRMINVHCKCPECLQICYTDKWATEKTHLFSSHGKEARCPLGCIQLAVSTSSSP